MNNPISKTAIQDTEQELCDFLDQVDTEAMLSAMAVQLSLTSIDGAIGDKNGCHPALLEIVARHAIPKFGINEGKKLTHLEFNQCYKLAEQHLAARMISRDNAANFEEASLSLDNIANRLSLQSEVVRGSAYPEQTAYRITEVQGKFDSWFQKKIGITPTTAAEIILALTQHIESAYNMHCDDFYEYAQSSVEDYEDFASKKMCTEDEKQFLSFFENADEAGEFAFSSKFNEVMPPILPVHIENLSTKEPISKQEADALKKLIGVSKQTIHQQTEMQRYPLYILNSGTVLLGNLSNCLDVLWDAFESVAKQDKSFYDNRYQNFRGKWLEKEGGQYLERIFSPPAVYYSLDYPNPDKDGMAQLDIAIKWGTFLILVEAKATQFQFESVRGDTGRLRTDLYKNIEHAYKQAARAIRYVNSNPKAVFIEHDTGRKLEIRKDSIQKIYSISLSLNHLAGTATQLHDVQELGLFKDKNFPFAICLADLDLITQADVTSETFLHYIERRLVVQNMPEVHAPDELGLFESYLNNRLDIRNMSMPDDENIDHIVIQPNSPMFNHFAMAMRGEIDTKPNLSLLLPDEILELLRQLSKRSDNGAKWIAFNLLDLDNNILEDLSHRLFEITQATLKPGIFRRVSLANDEMVITIIGSSPNTSLDSKMEHVDLRGKVEKYRRKLKKSIGIGVVCTGSGKLVLDTVQYLEGEWRFDAETEKLIETEPKFTPTKESKLPKRNEPCFCGSGKKYKKCCLKKVQENIR
ncbi:SEC-C metal-binding domain-containing protein [Candidatus Albibeggiatoa sp. nov. BB20]|uniref:SEC-C metal-binding domain-containing protein n=1 Tax=Candidatus Albibeggiatoa sp. nov. BB20 TaxID=3162723 RepID=UPI0033658955